MRIKNKKLDYVKPGTTKPAIQVEYKNGVGDYQKEDVTLDQLKGESGDIGATFVDLSTTSYEELRALIGGEKKNIIGYIQAGSRTMYFTLMEDSNYSISFHTLEWGELTSYVYLIIYYPGRDEPETYMYALDYESGDGITIDRYASGNKTIRVTTPVPETSAGSEGDVLAIESGVPKWKNVGDIGNNVKVFMAHKDNSIADNAVVLDDATIGDIYDWCGTPIGDTETKNYNAAIIKVYIPGPSNRRYISYTVDNATLSNAGSAMVNIMAHNIQYSGDITSSTIAIETHVLGALTSATTNILYEQSKTI